METQSTEKQSTGSSELKQKLQKGIEEARQRTDELKRELDAMQADDKEVLRQLRERARERADGYKQNAQELRANADAWRRERASHTSEAIASWKQRRELNKLQKRAERAEDYAADAVAIAIMEIDAAGEAMFEAVDARLEANAAGQQATT
jgi:hypothetical protein